LKVSRIALQKSVNRRNRATFSGKVATKKHVSKY
jgi:hypothetical protein